ncbi:sugar-binding transcriptional regulator [Enemella sp. A6]|uniref:sugar-binding transcriptional regulator n=1 Tax=Enemella sp. A6 TaxID=3440152 RepID=UPI003EBD6FF1
MPAKRDQQVLIDAARMYYLEDLDQGQIARRLGMSRSSVSRILTKARQAGIVEVRIVGDTTLTRHHELETAMRRTFGLNEVLVADVGSGDSHLGVVAELGAQVFTRMAASAQVIGFSWGHTISQLIESLPHQALRPGAVVVQLVGGMPQLDTGRSGNSNLQIVAERCRITAERFDAPAVVESAITAQAMMAESTVRAALIRAASADLAFVGIGSFGVQSSKKLLDAMKLDEDELARVLAAEPVGDINGRFYDLDGTPLGPPTSERVIGLTIDELRGIGTVVGIAAGQEKAGGVLGGIRTGIFDTLVVDSDLAAAVLALAGPGAVDDDADDSQP